MQFRARIKVLVQIVASLKLTTLCLLLLAVLTIWGTLYQVDHGLYVAQQRFFNSWILLLGGFLPFPCVRLCSTVLIVNLLAIAAFRLAWVWRNAGLIICHAGVIALLAGAGIVSYGTVESALTLKEGQSSSQSLVTEDPKNPSRPFVLPFTVTLIDFIKKIYPGTSIACGFESRIHVRGTDIDRGTVIAMNRPFRYRDYSFYQMSYTEDNDRTTSTLAVVKNPGRLVVPIAGIAIAIGLLLHFTIHLIMVIGRKQTEL